MKPEIRIKLVKVINRILDLVILLAVVGVPVFFLPVTAEIFATNKHLFMFSLAALALLLWAMGFAAEGKVRITVTPLLAPLGLLVIAAVISMWAGKSAPAESLIDRGGLLIAMFILSMVGSARSPKLGAAVKNGLILAAGLIGFSMIVGFSGLLSNFKADWLSGKGFSLTGNMLSGLLFLAVILPLVVKQFAAKLDKNGVIKKMFLAAAIVLIAAGIIVSVIQVYPVILGSKKSSGGLMPLKIGWQVAVETMKENPLFGTGPAGYMTAYTRYRPISTNIGDAWAQRYQMAPNELLQMFTTMGMAGLAVLVFLIWKLFKLVGYVKAENKQGLVIALQIMLISWLLLPLNAISISLLTSLIILLALSIKENGKAGSGVYDATLGLVALKEGLLKVENTPYRYPDGTISTYPRAVPATRQTVSTAVLPWLILVPAAIFSFLALWLTGRAWAAEVNYRKVLTAINNNDGTGAYNSSIRTLDWNPWMPLYHRQYADVNLRLANALAVKQDLSDQDRANVSQLVQQAIREGKLAVQINAMDVQNWEMLARIYRSLIRVADGAENWTVVAYTEAIKTDPINPSLRLELGGVFFNLEDWESAIQNFQAAVSLKPDYANGYYNLALAYEKNGKIQQAVKAMQATLQNIEAGSSDYGLAQSKLEELVEMAGKTLETKPAEEPQELSGPESLPTPLPGANRVELGEEEAPPVTPSPSPAAAEEPSEVEATVTPVTSEVTE